MSACSVPHYVRHVMNDGSKEDTSNNHPVQKSLSVFPVLTNKSHGILSSSTSVVLKEKKSKRKKRRIPNKVKFNQIADESILKADSSGTLQSERDELLYFKQTKARLDRVSDLLPVSLESRHNNSPDALELPPITPQITPYTSGVVEEKRDMSKEDWRPDFRAFSLPTIPVEKRPCTCKKSKSVKNFDKVLKKCIRKEFRAEETPPLFSIYVRWKNRRNGSSEYNQDTLREVFAYFGAVSKVIMKSKSSAIVVFHHVESACNADKVMQTMGKEMKMHVKWLNEMGRD